MSLFRELFHRLRLRWTWVVAQLVGTPLLILVGLAWTRLPDKHVWQVALSLLVPLLLGISVFELQAGTVRSFADDDGKRVKLVLGAISLLVWVAIGAACWAVLDWCDDQIPQWAGYLNSQAPASLRAKLFTFEHISLWLGIVEWLLRWVAVPGKLIVYASASAQWGWRLPWRRMIRFLWNWHWWAGVLLAALVAVALPGCFFAGEPSGTVHAQLWHVALKVSATYLLAVGSWVLLLGWFAVIFGGQQLEPEENGLDQELFKRLLDSRRWIGAMLGWTLLFTLVSQILTYLLPIDSTLQAVFSFAVGSIFSIAALVLPAGLLRSLLSTGGRRVGLVWGTLSMLIWIVLAVAALASIELLPHPILKWTLSWLVLPPLVIPWAASSAPWGLRLPWRGILKVLHNWRWWAGVLVAEIGWALAGLLVIGTFTTQTWLVELKLGIASLLRMSIWILLLGWLAVLFGGQQPPAEEVQIPVLVGPPDDDKESSVKLPSQEDR